MTNKRPHPSTLAVASLIFRHVTENDREEWMGPHNLALLIEKELRYRELLQLSANVARMAAGEEDHPDAVLALSRIVNDLAPDLLESKP